MRLVTSLGVKGPEFFNDSFIVGAVFFSVFFCVLEYLFGFFVNEAASVVVSSVPAILLFFLLRGLDVEGLGYAAVLAAALRLFTGLFPFRREVIVFGSFVLAGTSLVLNFVSHAFSSKNRVDIVLFACLVVLVLSSLQQLVIERGKEEYPFSFFLIMLIFMILIPVKDTPIDWTKVVEAGDRLIESTGYALDLVSYFFTDIFGIGDVRTGYGELTEAGGSFTGSPKTELVLYTADKTYILFEDQDTGKLMKRRRSLYLEGGRGVDRENLVSFLQMLYSQEVSRETAALFSRLSKVRVEYGFIRTRDEIAPSGSLFLLSGGKNVDGGSGKKLHRKGYSIQSEYLDIDYGSPYLIYIMKKAQEQGNLPAIGYEELRLYARDTYMLDLREVVSEEEYYDLMGKEKPKAAKDKPVFSERLKNLSRELTKGIDNDYDKCRAVEEYVRQYTYSLQVPEDSSKKVNMTSLEDIGVLADRFLFETGKGYCVHYASAMISLLEIEGIPARAAGGFCYLYPFEEQEAYSVSGNCAHTWVEAYIENVGWVPFEPTSAYYTATSLSWNKVAHDDRVKKSSDANERKEMNVPKLPDFDEIEEGAPSEDTTGKILIIAGIVALCVAVLFALIIAASLITKRLRYKYGTPQQKLRINVDELKRLIRKKSGESFRERGLLSDYVKRAPDEYQVDIEKVFMTFYALEYGPSQDPLTILEAANTARGIITELR